MSTSIDSIVLDETSDHVHPFVRIPRSLADAARAHKRATWTEIYGCADGYSAPVPDGILRDTLMAAIELGGSRSLTWIASADYRRPEWVESPAWRAWSDRWNALTTADGRRAMMDAELMPSDGVVDSGRRGAVRVCGAARQHG